MKESTEVFYSRKELKTTSVKINADHKHFFRVLGMGELSEGVRRACEIIQSEVMEHDNPRIIEKLSGVARFRNDEVSQIDLMCQRIEKRRDEILIEDKEEEKKKLLPESELKIYAPFTYPAYKQGKATIEDMRKELAIFDKNLDDYELEGRE